MKFVMSTPGLYFLLVSDSPPAAGYKKSCSAKEIVTSPNNNHLRFWPFDGIALPGTGAGGRRDGWGRVSLVVACVEVFKRDRLWLAALTQPDADASAVLGNELDAGGFERRDDSGGGVGASSEVARAQLHPLDRRNRHA